MLGLTFNDKTDYDLVREDDQVDVLGLTSLEPGKPLEIRLHHCRRNVPYISGKAYA